MTQAKLHRPRKRQLGQFLTPEPLAESLVASLPLTAATTVLEPSLGDGAFLLPLLRRFVALHSGPRRARVEQALRDNLYGVEIDPALHARCLARIEAEFGFVPKRHHLARDDFFRQEFFGEVGQAFQPDTNDRGSSKRSRQAGKPDLRAFDMIVGNPPFGGTLDPALQDGLDREFGTRGGLKIKKETYSFFLVKCVERLRPGGRLRFICSDSVLTIPTMKGLRTFLMDEGEVTITHLPEFSGETTYGMVVLDFVRSGPAEGVTRDGERLDRSAIQLSGNHSWGMSGEFARLFAGPRVGDFMIGTSGMTIGRNALFVRPVEGGTITEPYRFEFFAEPITLERERRRARLHAISPRRQAAIREMERTGAVRRNVRAVRRPEPVRIALPHPDYKPYNKANGRIVYAPPEHVIYWKDGGDAVRTFKKNGNWYLHGVGGQPYFEREGLTWPLVAGRFKTRYLPPGCILDSGAPCGFLRDGVPHDELLFLMAWTLAPLCAAVLKSVINHTVNIQSKDLERLPYPHWVCAERKARAVRRMQALVGRAQRGEAFSFVSPDVVALGGMFEWDADGSGPPL